MAKKMSSLIRKILSEVGFASINLFVIRQNYNFNGSKYDKKARKIIFHAFLLYDTSII